MPAKEPIFCGGADLLPAGERRLVIDPRRTCCFTGHRPEQLPDGDALERLRERTATLIRILGENGTDTFITGMARGFDLMAAELVMNDLTLPGLRIICAIPYEGQFKEMRTPQEKALYQTILSRAAGSVCFFRSYANQCYRVRNSFMVNYSSRLIGYLREDNLRSGTAQTVNMAKRRGRDIMVIHEKDVL